MKTESATIETMRDDAPPFTQKLAAMLKRHRVADVAARMGVVEQAIYNWINKSAVPRAQTCLQLARVLGVPLEWLLDDDQPIDPPPPLQLTEKLQLVLGDKSLEEVAQRVSELGVGQPDVTVADLERYIVGAAVPPDVAWRLASVLNVDHDWLILESIPVVWREVVGRTSDGREWPHIVTGCPERGKVTIRSIPTEQIQGEALRRYVAGADRINALIDEVEKIDWKHVSQAMQQHGDSWERYPNDMKIGFHILGWLARVLTEFREEYGFVAANYDGDSWGDPKPRGFKTMMARFVKIKSIVDEPSSIEQKAPATATEMQIMGLKRGFEASIQDTWDLIKRYHDAGGPLLKS